MRTQLLAVAVILFPSACGGAVSATAGDAGATNSSAPDARAEAASGEARDAGDTGVGDAGCSSIVASNYNQTCTTNKDCVGVGTGDTCSAPCAFVCGIGDVINASDLPAYQADLARTGFSSAGIGCGCPGYSYGPCCVGGKCEFDAVCQTISGEAGAGGAASSDAGVCPPGEILCEVGCSGSVACHATPCPPPPPCPPPASGCSASSPCAAGTNGCPPSDPSSDPNEGAPCSMPGLNCYGYGSFLCPETVTCTDPGVWYISCPLHPFGSDAGLCACPHAQ